MKLSNHLATLATFLVLHVALAAGSNPDADLKEEYQAHPAQTMPKHTHKSKILPRSIDIEPRAPVYRYHAHPPQTMPKYRKQSKYRSRSEEESVRRADSDGYAAHPEQSMPIENGESSSKVGSSKDRDRHAGSYAHSSQTEKTKPKPSKSDQQQDVTQGNDGQQSATQGNDGQQSATQGNDGQQGATQGHDGQQSATQGNDGQQNVTQGHDGQLSIDGYKLPKDFIYGCGTSAYQIEGAWKADGKGESIWDKFAHDDKGHIKGSLTGDVADDFYHTYEKDLPLFKKGLGINNFDFTLAWTRILPEGKGKTPNEKGVEFYRNVVKTAKEHGMSSSCTLYHWDLPQALQQEYKGWLSHKIVDDFRNYARVAMEALGSSCSRWISMNEPRTFCVEGYGTDGISAPGLKFKSANMTYKCMHNALLAHAAAHEEFQKLKEQGKVQGTFGIKIDGAPAKPSRPGNKDDLAAAKRSMAFSIGWDLAPLTKGHYPKVMRETLGDALPKFSAAQSKAVKDSYDIIYFDGYTSTFAQALNKSETCTADSDYFPSCVKESSKNAAGKLIGAPTASEWNFDVPDTLFEGFKYMHDVWGAKKLAVGETGLALKNFKKKSMEQQIHDTARITWYRGVLRSVKKSLEHGLPVVGFVPWSCVSNLEWSQGYVDFGLIYTKLGKNEPRTIKESARYLNEVLNHGKAT